MDSHPIHERPAGVARHERRPDLVVEIREVLAELRNRLAHELDDAAIAEMRREVDALLGRIQEDLAQPGESQARHRFERALALQPAFERLIRAWTEFRATAGIETAQEIRDRSDTPGGWRQRWGTLFEVAWSRRHELETSPRPGLLVARRRTVDSSGSTRSRADRSDPALALDLRYAAGLPLAQIAELLSLSPAAIQLRLAGFEDSVLGAAAADVVRRQVPEGWRLITADKKRAWDELTLIRQQGSVRAEISLLVIPVWTDREISPGRPRVTNRALIVGQGRRRSTIWVLVFSDGPRVTFLPENVLHNRVGPEVTQTELVSVADELGVDVLADAVRQTSSTGAGKNID